jgi:hypothetical protein
VSNSKWRPGPKEVEGGASPEGHTVEGDVVQAPMVEVGVIGLGVVQLPHGRPLVQHHQPVGVGEGEGTEEKAVEEGEDGRVRRVAGTGLAPVRPGIRKGTGPTSGRSPNSSFTSSRPAPMVRGPG